MSVHALVLTGFGINCDSETATAFRRAGAAPRIVHLNDLIESPGALHDCHVLAIPGGFSFGDDVASGKILANRLRFRLGEPLRQFVARGNLVIGICNGFQVLVKMGMLPMCRGEYVQEATLTYNDTDRFENRWVHLERDGATPCVWLRGIDHFDAPVRHGEGKFVPRDGALLEELRASGQIALRYAHPDGRRAEGVFPANPNGSVDDVAGICDPTGRVFGLMPHPEACLNGTNHPQWTRRTGPTATFDEEGPGLQVFKNAVAFAAERLVGGSAPAAAP